MNYSKFSVPKGVLMMAFGYASFLMGLMVLSSIQPSDPHWFGMTVIILTWLSCFLVIAGFIVRRSAETHALTIAEDQLQ